MLIDQGITDKSMYPSEFRVRSMMRKYGNLLKERWVNTEIVLDHSGLQYSDDIQLASDLESTIFSHFEYSIFSNNTTN